MHVQGLFNHASISYFSNVVLHLAVIIEYGNFSPAARSGAVDVGMKELFFLSVSYDVRMFRLCLFESDGMYLVLLLTEVIL